MVISLLLFDLVLHCCEGLLREHAANGVLAKHLKLQQRQPREQRSSHLEPRYELHLIRDDLQVNLHDQAIAKPPAGKPG